MKGQYSFLEFNFHTTDVPNYYVVDCDILKETEKSYKIKITSPCTGLSNGHQCGDVMWVRKKSVWVHREPDVDYTNAYWNN